MLATVGALELHVASLDTSDTEPSENVPVAVNGSFTITPALGLVGVSAIETKLALVTVNVAVPLTAPTAALIVEAPLFSPVASPALVIVALPGLDEAQVAVAVTSCVVRSLRVTTA